MNNSILPAANFHLWKSCNMRCIYCFATFKDIPDLSPNQEDQLKTIDQLAASGVDKLSFVGGEPTLCPWLIELIQRAKGHGLTTMLVTNGSMLLDGKLLGKLAGYLDWLSLSIDSLDAETNRKIGRIKRHGVPMTLRDYTQLMTLTRQFGLRLKINTVVSALNRDESLLEFIRWADPARWKVFQALVIYGQNERECAEWAICADEFNEFQERHASLGQMVPEDNNAMVGSYMMIDPLCRLYDNVGQVHHYSRPIPEIGLAEAVREVVINLPAFEARGGSYQWKEGAMAEL